MTGLIHWGENEESEDPKIGKRAKCMVKGEERVTRAGRIQGKGLTVRKMSILSIVEAGGGKKEMNVDVINFVALIKRRLRQSYLMELRKKYKLLNIA